MAPAPRKSPPPLLAVRASAADTYEWSTIMLARAHFDGTLELLTAAWGRTLGYAREELRRKTLGQLMGGGEPAAIAAIADILDTHDARTVHLTLRCRDGHSKSFDLHRRHDPDERQVYIVAEETFA